MEEEKKINNLENFVNHPDNLFCFIDFEEELEPKPQSWREIDGISFPEDRWLVPDLFPKEGMSIFASISGEGKSLLMMHLAHCITEGKPWFGHESFKTQQSRVLYINLEMAVSEMQRRGRKIGLNPDNENLIILNQDNFNLNEGPGSKDLKYKWLLKFIYDKKVKVVIIDTFRACSGGLKEEKAEEIRKFFQKFIVLKNSGISLIFLEHQRKGNQLEGKIPKKEMLLGSQDKCANAEVLLMIRKNDSTGNIDVYQRKNRLGSEVKPFAVKLTDVIDDNGIEKFKFEYAGEIDDDTNKKEEAKELVIDILSKGEGKNFKQLNELTKKQVGMKNLRAALKELENTGLVDYEKEGKRHVYFTPKEKASTEEGPLPTQKNIEFNDDS